MSKKPTKPDRPGAIHPWFKEKTAQRQLSREPMSRDQILAAALTILNEEGINNFSVRKLAASLDVTPPAIYWWVGKKDQLFALIMDKVMSEVTLGAPSAHWLDRVKHYANSGYKVFSSNPAVVEIAQDGVVAGPNSLKVINEWIINLADAGFSPAAAVKLHRSITNLVVGSVETIGQSESDARWREGVDLRFLESESYSGLARAGAELFNRSSSDQQFKFNLDIFIRGLVALSDDVVQ